MLDAALRGDVGALRTSLSSEAAPDLLEARSPDGGWTALSLAAASGHAPCVRALLAAGADPNGADALGRTALAWAATTGNAECAAELLRAGADVNRTDAGGLTPLLLAASHPAAARALVRAGAGTRARDALGRTALMLATLVGATESVHTLLGADPECARLTDAAGVTALHLAAAGGHADIARLLLGVGADALAPDAIGRAPIDNALRRADTVTVCTFLECSSRLAAEWTQFAGLAIYNSM